MQRPNLRQGPGIVDVLPPRLPHSREATNAALTDRAGRSDVGGRSVGARMLVKGVRCMSTDA
jgi:hypothetical protein